jgi:hypothetical protein
MPGVRAAPGRAETACIGLLPPGGLVIEFPDAQATTTPVATRSTGSIGTAPHVPAGPDSQAQVDALPTVAVVFVGPRNTMISALCELPLVITRRVLLCSVRRKSKHGFATFDVVLLATAHNRFKNPKLWAGLPLVVDTRNMIAPLCVLPARVLETQPGS